MSEHRAGEDGGGANRPRNILQSQSPGRRGINRESLRQMTVFAKLARNTPLQSRCSGNGASSPQLQCRVKSLPGEDEVRRVEEMPRLACLLSFLSKQDCFSAVPSQTSGRQIRAGPNC